MSPKKTLSLEDCYECLDQKIFINGPMEECEEGEGQGWLGLEVESFPLKKLSNNNQLITLPLYGPEGSVLAALEDLVSPQDEWLTGPSRVPGEEGTPYPYCLNLAQGGRITFEPGAQVEFSSAPAKTLSELIQSTAAVQKKLDACFEKKGAGLYQWGVHPFQSAEEVGLHLRQGRYQCMDQFFARQGPWGQRMMRLSCGIQVNLDFGCTKKDLPRRYLAAQLLAPFVAAIFANSPFYGGKLVKEQSYRARFWRGLDETRSGIDFANLNPLANNLSRDFCVESFLKYVLKAWVIYVEPCDFYMPEQAITFDQWLKEGINYKGATVYPTLEDFVLHLSLLFPEVRPRGFLELRSSDSQCREYQYVPLLFWTALIYDADALQGVLDLLIGEIPLLPKYLKQAEFGLADPNLRSLSQKLMQMALSAYPRLSEIYQEKEAYQSLKAFTEKYTFAGRVPAEDLREAFEKGELG